MRKIVFFIPALILMSCSKDNIYPPGYPGGETQGKVIDSNVTVIPSKSGKAHIELDYTFNGSYDSLPSEAEKTIPFTYFGSGDAVNNGQFIDSAYVADQDINVNIKSRIYFNSESGTFWYAICKNGQILEESYKFEENNSSVDSYRDLSAWNIPLLTGDKITVKFRSYGTTTIKAAGFSYLEVKAY